MSGILDDTVIEGLQDAVEKYRQKFTNSPKRFSFEFKSQKEIVLRETSSYLSSDIIEDIAIFKRNLPFDIKWDAFAPGVRLWNEDGDIKFNIKHKELVLSILEELNY